MATFREVEQQFRALADGLERGELARDVYVQAVGRLMCQDEAGRWWTIHPDTGIWHFRWQEEWRPGVPPGHTPGTVRWTELAPDPEKVESPAPAVKELQIIETRGLPRWLSAAIIALVMVVAVLALVFGVVLPRLGLGEATEAVVPTALLPAPSATVSIEPTAVKAPPTEVAVLTPTRQMVDFAHLRPDWPEVMEDGFDNVDSGWSRGAGDGVLVDYRESELRIELGGPGLAGWSRFESLTFEDGWAEIWVTDFSTAAGIALHVTGDHDGYVFRIDSVGRFSVASVLPYGERPLVDWTPSPFILRDDDFNHLAVHAEGGRYYSFYVNGGLVTVIDHGQSPTGMLALWAGSEQADRGWATFDQALLLEAPDEETAESLPVPAAGTGITLTEDISPAATPTLAVTTTEVITATETITDTGPLLPTLTFELAYDSWYPGSGDQWITRFVVQASGGDGDYSYQLAGKQYTANPFDVTWPCDLPLSAQLVVLSGDGQQAAKSVWIQPASCQAR